MKELNKFIYIFEGLDTAHGITKKSSEINEKGKNKTTSFTIHKPPVEKLWQDHLDGKDPGLGIIPINQENKLKWGCIDVDIYPVDHQAFVKKLQEKKVKAIVFRSKSGGAHIFMFTKTFVPAIVMRTKLKMIASSIGHARAEIYPKQDYINVARGDTGSFLNLPYYDSKNSVRYAFNSKGIKMSLEEFFDYHNEMAMTEEELTNFTMSSKTEENDFFKGMSPCLVTLLSDGVPNGQRNNCMYNVGVYLKKRYPENDEWQGHMHIYDSKFMQPPLGANEINVLKKSLTSKDYQYKCKDEPICSFCDAKKCALKEFGIGDDGPTPEITEIRKYESEPPIWFVSLDGTTVEVDGATLHDAEKFSVACMEQIGKPLMPIPKHAWRKGLIKLMAVCKTITAPDSSKISVQLTEILADYINRTPGRDKDDILRGVAFTDKSGVTMFKFANFWKYLLRTKSWADKTYPKQKTMRMLQDLFLAKESTPKIDGKTHRVLEMKHLMLDKPSTKKYEMEKEPWQ